MKKLLVIFFIVCSKIIFSQSYLFIHITTNIKELDYNKLSNVKVFICKNFEYNDSSNVYAYVFKHDTPKKKLLKAHQLIELDSIEWQKLLIKAMEVTQFDLTIRSLNNNLRYFALYEYGKLINEEITSEMSKSKR